MLIIALIEVVLLAIHEHPISVHAAALDHYYSNHYL